MNATDEVKQNPVNAEVVKIQQIITQAGNIFAKVLDNPEFYDKLVYNTVPESRNFSVTKRLAMAAYVLAGEFNDVTAIYATQAVSQISGEQK